jgi:hypothetical protein
MKLEQYKKFTINNEYGLFWVRHPLGYLMTVEKTEQEARQYIDEYVNKINKKYDRGFHARVVILDEATEIK